MTRYFRGFTTRADGSVLELGLYRRSSDTDVIDDAVVRRDRRWHSTGDLELAQTGFLDHEVREITETEAARVIEEFFGDPSLLHAPTYGPSPDASN